MTGWHRSAVTLAVFLPAVGAAVVALTPAGADRVARRLAVAFTGAALVVGIAMLFGFHYGAPAGGGNALQFQANAKWIPAIQARYHVGVDGISLPLFELTLLLSFLCAIYSLKVIPSPGKARGFLALMLLLETGMAGTFVAFDLVLFFVFWELVLVPMYFLIGIWGSGRTGSTRRSSSSCTRCSARSSCCWASSACSSRPRRTRSTSSSSRTRRPWRRSPGTSSC